MSDATAAPPPPPTDQQWQQYAGYPNQHTSQYSYYQQQQAAQPASHESASATLVSAAPAPSTPPPAPDGTQPAQAAPGEAPAAGYQSNYTSAADQAAWASYYQQYNSYYYSGGYQQPQQQPWQGYQQPTSYGAMYNYAQQAAAPPSAPVVQGPAVPAAVPAAQLPIVAAVATQPTPTQPAVSRNLAPWQQAAAKVAEAIQAKADAAPPAAAASQPKAGTAKSFSIRPQAGKFALGGASKAFAVASSPAYVKVADKPAATPPKNPSQFPPAMRSYVERAFLAAKTPEQKKALQPALKAIIDAASAKGELWMTNWNTLPLPNLAVLTMYNSAAVAASVVSSIQPVAASPTKQSGGGTRWDAVKRGQKSSWDAPSSNAAQKQSVPDAPQPPEWLLQRQRKRQKMQGNSTHRYVRSPSPSSSSDSGGRSSKRRGWNLSPSPPPMSLEERRRRDRRAGRFGSGRAQDVHDGSVLSGSGLSRRDMVISTLTTDDIAEEIDLEQFTIKGTCERLEKSYFRLTAAPDPASVRPERVLRAALDQLLHRIRAGDVKYLYVADQFKAMRQDCTVQHLRNELTVRIYQAHARAALEWGDPAEYNQCQTQLNALALEGVPGAVPPEFLAYRLLYQTVHASQGEASALLSAMGMATSKMAAHKEVAHAMQVRQAVSTDDYAAFFRLYADAPAMGRAILDMFVTIMRWRALNTLVRAFKPSLAVSFLARLLGFIARKEPHSDAAAAAGVGEAAALEVLPGCSAAEFAGKYKPEEDGQAGFQACLDWLEAHGAVLIRPTAGEVSTSLLDCKASVGQLHTVQDVTAVAHGDENLDLNDFLAKLV